MHASSLAEWWAGRGTAISAPELPAAVRVAVARGRLVEHLHLKLCAQLPDLVVHRHVVLGQLAAPQRAPVDGPRGRFEVDPERQRAPVLPELVEFDRARAVLVDLKDFWLRKFFLEMRRRCAQRQRPETETTRTQHRAGALNGSGRK